MVKVIRTEDLDGFWVVDRECDGHTYVDHDRGICDYCGERKATVRSDLRTDGRRLRVLLCDDCAWDHHGYQVSEEV